MAVFWCDACAVPVQTTRASRQGGAARRVFLPVQTGATPESPPSRFPSRASRVLTAGETPPGFGGHEGFEIGSGLGAGQTACNVSNAE